ncbi:MAG: hypothetical protein AAGC71_01085 [Pseudomonadota bacterium]
MGKHDDHERLRAQVAQEAARIIAEQGIDNFGQAKRKAGARLNIRGRAALPTNAEIERALVEHQALFGREAHTNHIEQLRRAALQAMERLQAFTPRLVGPVAAGTAGEGAAINLHVFTDTPEDVLFTLENAGFAVDSYQRRLKNRRDATSTFPGYAFRIDDADVEATVFPVDGLRQAPCSPVDGRPMKRLRAEQIEQLLAESALLTAVSA